jgi:Flp pilus assembly protein TadG
MMSREWKGQVLVEMLLVLPVFLTIVFTIMELGYIAFQMIVLNHATYEVARIGGMVQYQAASGNVLQGCGNLEAMMKRIIPSADVSCGPPEATVQDQQANQMNHDLVVTGTNRIQLIFPISKVLLSNPRGSGYRLIAATVRMPIEQPLLMSVQQ